MTQSTRSVAAFWFTVVLLLLSVGSSALPSPLYPVYAATWNLSPLLLTGAFAVYVVGLLLALLCAGSLSDFVGRKPVLIVGTLGAVLSMVIFVLADGYAALMIGRAVQGLSVGLLLGTLGATLLDHSLERRPALAGVLNGVTPPTALGAGALSSGVLVEWAPAPEQLIYIVFGASLLVVAVLLLLIPETVERQPGAVRSLVPTMAVPADSQRLLRDVSGALIASWALAGLYLSLVPSLLTGVFDVHSHFAAGGVIAVFAGCGAVTGFALQRMDPRRELIIGLVALIVGPVVSVISVLSGGLPGVIVGTAIAGIGFGAGFQSGLRMLLATAASEHRAGLLSTIYVISYLAFGLPSVVAGIVDPYTGLVAAFTGYGVLVVAAALVALILQLRSSDPVEAEAAETVERQEAAAR
ncbi:MFS transporter [Rathayibacter sp. Leaf296]|uniref:MFS transporter n=1 Tax=Rathayibacter sp. Leaf296 TaxID=1736327 RepID=UPI00070391A2|nr:MFS transporter [Rathayibacter sp. Leaf296]KQQ08496.1 MFS transporter [Rathayibacter sp. Leaf296]